MAEPDGSLPSPGQVLGAARRERGLELPALAASTRIAEQFLAALEADEHDILPPLYIRSFLRTYAAALGLSPEEVLALHDRHAARPVAGGGAAPVWEQEVTVRRVGEGETRRWLRWVGLVLLALIVVLAAVKILDRSGRRVFGSGLGPAGALFQEATPRSEGTAADGSGPASAPADSLGGSAPSRVPAGVVAVDSASPPRR
jgi:hypothetical protein